MFPPQKYNLLGVGMSRINLDSGTEAVFHAVKERRRGYVTVTGVHGVIEAQDDPEFRRILNGSLMTTPDGMPTVWCGRAKGYHEMGRVYGPDLMWRVFGESAARGVRHFFYGGREGVADLLKQKLEDRFPGVQITGTYCPPFRPLNDKELADLQQKVREAQPDILWVGLSTPKQERFMSEYFQKLDVTLMIGVGAAFDFHAGLVAQAPRWVQRSGLEWFYRLCTEPKRLWRRYLTIVPRFIWLLGCAGLRRLFHSNTDR